jgi:hypothetical protein
MINPGRLYLKDFGENIGHEAAMRIKKSGSFQKVEV